jgi:hypothetical protein
MRSSRVLGRDLVEWLELPNVNATVRVSPGFDPSILRRAGTRVAENEAVLNKVRKKCI